MTWLDVSEGRPTDKKREKLLADRASIEAKVLKLRGTPLRNSTQSASLERYEIMLDLAKQIKSIDTKLGRTHV